jgi:GH25 family lysozyme M1 (1,4-beta-N-acetylmuramidase)
MSNRPILGVDVSHWQSIEGRSLVNFRALKDEGGVEFAGIKADESAMGHLVGARDANMKTIMYHWHDPTLTIQKNLDKIEEMNRKYQPDFWSEDIEHWWSNWSLWWKAIYKEIPWTSVPKVNSGSLNSHAYQVFQGAKEIVKKPTLLYTGMWFVRSYCPKMEEWMKEEYLWLADYSSFGPALKKLTWEQIRALPMRYTDGSYDKPAGVRMELIHQFTDKLIVPGAKSPIDFNILFGGQDALSDLAGGIAPEIPEVVVEKPVQKFLYEAKMVRGWVLTIRNKPSKLSGAYSDYLTRGKTIQVWEEKDGYGRISEFDQRWVCLYYFDKI